MKKKKIILAPANSFGSRFREVRKKHGLSQSDFAKKLGYKNSASISNIESGKGPVDSVILMKLSEFGEVDYNWLLTGNRLPDKDLELAYNKLVHRMAEHVAQSLADCFKLREQYVLELAEELTKKQKGEDYDEELIDQLNLDLENVHKEIAEFGKDQPWLQEAIQRINDNLRQKYSDDKDLKK
jgi:transcriptional regulator with XRE-family HTH domain